MTILNEYKIPHKLAEDAPSLARPISTKVADTMEQCDAAIIVFTPDEELRDLEGNPVFRPSQGRTAQSFWRGLTAVVMAHPWKILLPVTAVLLLLGSPFSRIRLGASDLYLVGYAAVFLVVMLLLPRGILPSLVEHTRRLRARRLPPPKQVVAS